jgi:hypothetical protein
MSSPGCRIVEVIADAAITPVKAAVTGRNPTGFIEETNLKSAWTTWG